MKIILIILIIFLFLALLAFIGYREEQKQKQEDSSKDIIEDQNKIKDSIEKEYSKFKEKEKSIENDLIKIDTIDAVKNLTITDYKNIIEICMHKASKAVKGDQEAFLSIFTEEARTIFTPSFFNTLFHQFIDKDITFEDFKGEKMYKTQPMHINEFGNLVINGFYIREEKEDNLIVFMFSIQFYQNNEWKLTGVHLKAYPKENMPSKKEIDSFLEYTINFNDALRSKNIDEIIKIDKETGASPSDRVIERYASWIENGYYNPRKLSLDDIYFDDFPGVSSNTHLTLRTFYLLDDPSEYHRMDVYLGFKKTDGIWRLWMINTGPAYVEQSFYLH